MALSNIVDEKYRVKKYKVQYPISEYTFPREATIREVHFDDEHMHVELTDGRIMSVPLRWIPTVYHASPEERAKYELNRSRTMIIWDPAKCAINDEIRITDYFGQAPG